MLNSAVAYFVAMFVGFSMTASGSRFEAPRENSAGTLGGRGLQASTRRWIKVKEGHIYSIVHKEARPEKPS